MNTMSDSKHVSLDLPAFALDLLDIEESSRVADHLRYCPQCEAELQSLRATADQLVLAVPTASPDVNLRERLLDQITLVQKESVSQSTSGPLPAQPRALAPAFLVIVLILLVANLWQWQQSRPFAAANRAGQMQSIAIRAGDSSDTIAAYVIISSDGNSGALIIDKLPMLSEDKQYQVWLLIEGQRDSGGLFNVRENGYGGVRLTAPRPLVDYTALGVTIEPAGGSEGPTGERVLFGELQKP